MVSQQNSEHDLTSLRIPWVIRRETLSQCLRIGRAPTPAPGLALLAVAQVRSVVKKPARITVRQALGSIALLPSS